jgi:sec-independent protein translocase protein TatC
LSTPPTEDELTIRPPAPSADRPAPPSDNGSAASAEAPATPDTPTSPPAINGGTPSEAPFASGVSSVDPSVGAPQKEPTVTSVTAAEMRDAETPSVQTSATETSATQTPTTETPALETSSAEGPITVSPVAETPVAPATAPATPTTETPGLATSSLASDATTGSGVTEAVAPPPAYEPPVPPPPAATDALPPPSPDPEDEEEGMTMMEHLEELRVRVIISCVALLVGVLISAIPVPGYNSLTFNVINVLVEPTRGIDGFPQLQYIYPGEAFINYFKVALILAGSLAMPVLIYQMIAFVLPALHPHEKKYLYMAVPGSAMSFIVGILFGYLLLLPFAIRFLLNFGVEDTGIRAQWSFGAYVGTVATLLFWMGLSFQTPLVMFFLAKLRVVSVERLVRFRRYALILAFVVGAIITPTPDPLNQTIVSLPLYLLFELGILMAKLA